MVIAIAQIASIQTFLLNMTLSPFSSLPLNQAQQLSFAVQFRDEKKYYAGSPDKHALHERYTS